MRVTFTVFAFLFFFASSAQRQNADQLAQQFYEQKEFDKANLYYEQLYDRNPDTWYGQYFRSLMAAKDFNRAEKIAKKQLKRNRQDAAIHVDIARTYEAQGDEKKAQDERERALKELLPVQPFVQSLAAAFRDEKQYAYALKVYDKARRANPDYPYYYERAEILREMNDVTGMVNEYLDALEYRESELVNVRTLLQNSLGYDDDAGGMRNPILRQELQKRIQRSPEKVVFAELLVFILTQQREFNAAFVQSRALDKRMKEEGQRVYDLAQLCVSNEDWETARKCYDYLVEKGPRSAYYDMARLEGAHAEFLALTQRQDTPREELLKLEQKMLTLYTAYGQTTLAGNLLKDLANLEAFYLGKTSEAIALLDAAIGKPGVEPAMRAGYKLLLADVYLVSGQIWDASLLYSQVEKDFKYEAIGQEAKFRNAKLSYYAGDFKWAKTQADVLKGATSKLIANDALDLSLVISDAIGVDTNDLPLRLFASAELMSLQHRYTEAIARMDSINLLFSSHTLADDIYYRKAQIYLSLGRYADAEAMYKNILEYFPNELFGDDAQFRLAELYELKLHDAEKARQAYEDVLTRYPGSIFTVEARKRYRQLRGDRLNN